MKQYLPKRVIAQGVGGIYSQLTRTLGYWSMFNSIVILFLGWDSNMGHIIMGWFPWITLPIFLIIVLVVFILVSILDLLFVLPAVYAFVNRQATSHDNPIYDKVGVMEKELQELKGMVSDIQGRIK